MVELLLCSGASPSARDGTGMLPEEHAPVGSRALVARLRSARAAAASVDLMRAARVGDPAGVRSALEAGVNDSALFVDALHAAGTSGHALTVREFLSTSPRVENHTHTAHPGRCDAAHLGTTTDPRPQPRHRAKLRCIQRCIPLHAH